MIFDKVLEIYQKYYICVHCLGRMFSLLSTNTTNYDRGNSLLLSITMENHRNYISGNEIIQKESIANLKLLANKAYYNPAQKVLENEGLKDKKNDSNQICYLCHNIFSNVKKYIEKANKLLEQIEFNSFLIGSKPEAHIINREDKFKSEFNLLEAESFKSHFNRIVGKQLMLSLEKVPEFINPDVLLIYSLDFDSFNIEVILKSLFIYGRYNKLIRGIPQTHWFCKNCMGNGCELCNYTGKQYLTSVEDLIIPEFIKESKAKDSKFHGAGREDIDVRMLGTGRPFILELRNPKIRSLNLGKILKEINKNNKKKVRIFDLKYSSKNEVIKLKTEAKNTKKVYRAIVKSKTKLNKNYFNHLVILLKKTFENQEINQRTPHRVSHRRSDKVRKKLIYKIEGTMIKPNLFEFLIETQGGTYIKELINGDKNRTTPSFSEIFKIPLECKELDVLQIDV
ncbi:MAG: tRNA pseudouridine(54/55) synthase Pus10 [Promethearchaeota archaeon]|nr:MAG: tRNA pseudouridine(54/55) synthase Pus10 [Candidatus Lokiarchaeota archaeon]